MQCLNYQCQQFQINYRYIYVILFSSPTNIRIFSCPISYVTLWLNSIISPIVSCNLVSIKFFNIIIMLYEIKSDPMHTLCDATPAWGLGCSHVYMHDIFLCRTSSIPGLWYHNRNDPVLGSVGLIGFKSRFECYIVVLNCCHKLFFSYSEFLLVS